jgi:rod shape-determining protein MreD
MKMKKILILIIFFYLLTLFQTSFLIHFNILGITPNLILIVVLVLNIFEKPKKVNGIFGAGISGFFWDIFSNKPLGFHLLILVIISVLIKVILRRYVQFPNIKRLWKNTSEIEK